MKNYFIKKADEKNPLQRLFGPCYASVTPDGRLFLEFDDDRTVEILAEDNVILIRRLEGECNN